MSNVLFFSRKIYWLVCLIFACCWLLNLWSASAIISELFSPLPAKAHVQISCAHWVHVVVVVVVALMQTMPT